MKSALSQVEILVAVVLIGILIFLALDDGGFLVSSVWSKVLQPFELPDWAANSYPQVILHQE